MPKVGLICDATVPPGMEASVTIREDIDHDGNWENEATQKLRDGTYVYVLNGFEVSEESNWSNQVSLGRDDENYNYTIRDDPEPPSISSIQLVLNGGSESSDLDPNAIIWKFREVDYFLSQMKRKESDSLPFNLGGFLNSVYSIDEVIPTGWEEWADTEGQIQLHRLMMELRHQYVHLRKPSRGSIKPPLTQTVKWDFGHPSGIIRGQYIFDVHPSIIEEYVEQNDVIEPASQDKKLRDSPYARIVPVIPVCQIYIRLLFQFLSDWFDQLDEGEYDIHVKSLVN